MKRVLVVAFIMLVFASAIIVFAHKAGGSFVQYETTSCDVLDAHYVLPAAPIAGVRFAAIGDYGAGNQAEADVAALVESWQPDFILTLGDNNYPRGDPAELDSHIGQYYQAYIGNYQGDYGSGAAENRFFPALGNHDWLPGDISAYLKYFSLDQRYYTFTQGPMQFFVLDSDPHEPDGITSDSAQAAWLQQQLAASTAPFKVVALHHPPYSSGQHGSTEDLQWDYQAWGADVVLSGHDHTYERLIVDGFPYFVNGLGGQVRYAVSDGIAGSMVRYNCLQGAMVIDATANTMVFRFITTNGDLVDSYSINVIDQNQ